MGVLDGLLVSLAAAGMFTPAATSPCPNGDAVPRAEVRFTAAMTGYSEAFPAKRLKEVMAGNPNSTMATDTRAIVFGVTHSRTTGNVNVRFGLRTRPDTGEQCLYVEAATFEIVYTPEVMVASDILGMDCSYGVTRAHEQQHVAIDYKVMQDYLPHIRRDMQVYLNTFGHRGFGPYPAQHSQTWRDRLAAQVNAATKPMLERLKEARRKNQGVIDTAENYRRESDKCPQDRAEIGRRFGRGR